MTTEDDRRESERPSARDVRERAEVLMRARSESRVDPLEAALPSATRAVLHELRVHQVELELQNEELRAIQTELAASRAAYVDLYELAPVGYVTVDEAGLVAQANLTASELLGVVRSKLLGQPLTGLVAAVDQDILYHLRRRLGSTGEPQSCELRLAATDGAERWARLQATRAEGAAGAHEIRVVLSDITELRREQREREALQARVSQSDRLASVGLLSAGIAHEINNPLSYILSNLGHALELLGDAGGSLPASGRAEVVSTLAEATGGAERVRQIVRELMTFSRSDDDRRVAVDVEKVLEATLRLVGHEIRNRAHLVCDFGEVPPVDGSELHLSQVFLNLVMNAVQAMPEGDFGHHELRLSTRLTADGRVSVEVRDTGSGIPPEILGRVFDPFFTTKPVGVGTGLGLSICHSLVARGGGEIRVESAVGRGTSFTVFLPMAKPRAAPPAVAAPPAPPVAARRGHLLVIDDEPIVGRMLGRLLAREHAVEVLTSAREAIARIEAGERFDAIFCDLMMPELSGVELHGELLRVAPDQAARMVFVTGGAFGASAIEFLDRVPNPRLFKPFAKEQVQGALVALLGARP
jgi:two-component system cell cycle sensor histidine kinase/response regulator CckA